MLLAWGLLLALLAASWQGADMRPLDLWRDAGNMAQYARGFFPPDFRDWRHCLAELVVTFQIALWGTALAILCSVPLALLASGNITPWWVHQPVRRLLDGCRAINEMVFALLFVVAVGLGPFAGVLALWVHTTGTLAKLFSEAVEAIDPQPVIDGLRGTKTVDELKAYWAENNGKLANDLTAHAALKEAYKAQLARIRAQQAKEEATDVEDKNAVAES